MRESYGVEVAEIDLSDSEALHAYWDVGRRTWAERPVDLWPAWSAAQHAWTMPNEHRESRFLVARRGEEPVGGARVAVSRPDNPHLAIIEVWVPPEQRRRGVGSALIDVAERLAIELGRTTFLAWVAAPLGERSGGLEFAEGHGYPVEGLEQMKAADLVGTEDTWPALAERAAAKAGGYELVWWGDATPAEYVEPTCVLYTRFLGEIPLGGVDLQPQQWDEARLRTSEQRRVSIGQQHLLVAARAPGGSLAGYTDLVRDVDSPQRAGIDGTLVLSEHRGHSLGLAMKVRLHQLVRDQWPGCEVVLTGNAGVNAHMNAVNDLLGYRVFEELHDVQKVLAPS